jgi:flagellar protein FlaG
MSADTFVSALFIITAVVAAGVLINAVYPVVWSTASTFSSSAHDTDTRMRTDFKVVNTYAESTHGNGTVWMKNIGTSNVGSTEIQSGDVFFGPQGNFNRMTLWSSGGWTPGMWKYTLFDDNGNAFWDTGETLEITAGSVNTFSSGEYVTFQFVLSNGVYRQVQFTAV